MDLRLGSVKIALILTCLLVFLSGGWITAQQNDAGLWLSTSFEKNWNKVWQFELDLEARMNENSSQVETSFADLSARYELGDFIRITGNYRIGTRINDDRSYSDRHRYALDLTAVWELGKVDMDYRTRYQWSRRTTVDREGGVEFRNTWRHKLSADTKLVKKLRGGISTELFLSDDVSGLFLSDIRTQLGLKYKVNKKQDLKVGYLFQTELQQANPLREWIFTLGYAFEID